MSREPIDLYERLPAFYRRRDAEQGHPLRALLDIIAEQADVVKHDIEGLADDFFIETCAEWVVPYIGDLVGNDALHEAVRRRRADVAKTIYYRRRKGTLPMLEEMARDVTGWGIHAVDFFELLAWTQNLNHQRYRLAPNPDGRNPTAVDRVGTVHLRNLDVVDRVHGPFDEIAHTADIRPIGQSNGWHNLRKLGFFIWRLQAYPMESVQPSRSTTYSGGFHVSPVGHPIPLFTNPQREAAPAEVATELHVPASIRPFAFSKWKEEYYGIGPGKSIAIYVGNDDDPLKLVLFDDFDDLVCDDFDDLVCMDLDPWREPPKDCIGVDVRRGRLAFPLEKAPDRLRVTYHYGFSADLGGGPYQRTASFVTLPEPNLFRATVKKIVDSEEDEEDTYTSLEDALDAWHADIANRAVITIEDNGTYVEPVDGPLAGKQQLVIRADNGQRPTVQWVDADGRLSELVVDEDTGSEAVLRLNGLLIEGGVRVQATSGLERLELQHCTLLPGRERDESGHPVWPALPAVVVEESNASTRVEIDRCITGPLRCPKTMQELTVTDSIIDAPDVGHPAQSAQALLSGSLSSFPDLAAETPTLEVTIGDAGPVTITLAERPTTLFEARDELRAAFRRVVYDRDVFSQTLVGTVSKRLVVLPGIPGAEVHFSEAGSDPTVAQLRLADDEVDRREALVSAPLATDLSLRSDTPRMSITLGDEGPHTVELTGERESLAQVRDTLQQAIRDASEAPSFKNAYVITTPDENERPRLVLLAGTPGGPIRIDDADNDLVTPCKLRLRKTLRRIALSSGTAEDRYGPPATIERTTIFGETHVKKLALASKVIFTDSVRVERQQAGCIRFSYVPDDTSKTPRRYRCQPDLALEARAEEEGTSVGVLPAPVKDIVRARLAPAFTSVHYGDPGYAQLSVHCAEEIRTGGEEGAEMGAFNHLYQPQRETNLHVRLEEYLPFGLEPGLIYIT